MPIDSDTLETQAEQLLWQAVRDGRRCDLGEIDGRPNDPSAAGTWSDERHIRGALIQQLLDVSGPTPHPRPRKIHLIGARVTGPIDLEAVTLSCPLWLESCLVEEVIVLEQAEASFVDLTGSQLHGLRAHQLTTSTSLYLAGARSDGPIDISGARIGGSLWGGALLVTAPGEIAVDAHALTVGQGVDWSSLQVEGSVLMSAATVGGYLDLQGATILGAPDNDAFNAEGATISGHAFLRNDFKAYGVVNFYGARVSGSVDISDAVIDTRPTESSTDIDSPSDWSDSPALRADSIVVDQPMFLRNLTAYGEVSLLGADLRGGLYCEKAHFDNPLGTAFNGERASVKGPVICESMRAVGGVRISGIHVTGSLDFSMAEIVAAETDNDHITIDATLAVVDQPLLLSGIRCEGLVDLSDARVFGRLDLVSARLSNPSSFVLLAERLTVSGDITGGLYEMPAADTADAVDTRSSTSIGLENPEELSDQALDKACVCDGALNFGAARIEGVLDLTKAIIDAPAVGQFKGWALFVDQASIGQGVLLNGATVNGMTSFSLARIEGQLSLVGATLGSMDPLPALNLEGATVGGTLDARGASVLDGGFDFSRAHVAALEDDIGSWPAWLELDGFVYGLPADADSDWRTRVQWLSLHRKAFTPRIYTQLADAYRAAGHEGAARRVLIERERAQRQSDSGRRLSPARIGSVLYERTLGFGYAPWWLAFWWPLLFVIALLTFRAQFPQNFAAVDPGPGQPAFRAWIYSLDLLLPVVHLGQRDAWIPHAEAQTLTTAFTLIGWFIATVVVAGLAGVVKRD